MDKQVAASLNRLKNDRFVSNLSSRDRANVDDFFIDYLCGNGSGDDSSGDRIMIFTS